MDVPADLLSGTPLPDEAAIFRAMHGWDGVGGRHHRADLEDEDVDDGENSNRSGLWILKRANPVFSSDDEYESPPKRSRGCGSGGTVSARPSDEDHGDCASDDAEPREDLAAVEREADRAAPPSPFCLPERHLPEAAEEGPGTVLGLGPAPLLLPGLGGGGSRGTCSQGSCPSANDAPALLTHPPARSVSLCPAGYFCPSLEVRTNMLPL